jgi:hypothetical protein
VAPPPPVVPPPVVPPPIDIRLLPPPKPHQPV